MKHRPGGAGLIDVGDNHGQGCCWGEVEVLIW